MQLRESNPFRSRVSTLITVLAFGYFAAPSLFAVTFTWTGGSATSGQWNIDGWANFGGGVANVSGQDIIYGSQNDNGFTLTSLGGSRTLGSLTFQAGSPAYNIRLTTGVAAATAANLAFNSANTGITVEAGDTSSHTIGVTGGDVVLQGNLSVTHNGSGTLAINRPITGASFGITKEGTGTMKLDGANTYTGATQVNGGILTIGSLAAYGSTSGVTVGGGGTIGLGIGSAGTTTHYTFADVISLFNTNTLAGFTLDAASVVAVDTTALSFDVINQGGAGTELAGTRSLTKLGTKTLQLNQTNTYTGATIIKEGGLNVGAGLNGGKLNPVSTITVGSGATFGVFRQNSVTQGTDFSAAAITGGGNFAQFGTGITTLNAANSYTGTTTVAGGLLKYEGSATLALTPGNLILDSGVLGLTEDLTRARGTGDNQLRWTGSAGFAAFGADRIVTLGGGNVQWNAGSFVPAGQSLILGHTTATHTVTFANNINFAGGARTIQVNDGAADVDAIMSGTLGLSTASNGSFTKTGDGTLALTASNFYTGATTISAGTLRVGANDVFTDATAVSIGTATLDVGATFTDTAGTLNCTAAAIINLGDGASKLVFADSSAIAWTGTLNITGTFVPGSSLKFGTTNGGLTPDQLLLITIDGSAGPFSLDANGFLVEGTPSGYANWQAVNSTTGGRDEDHDNDGVSNGVEFFLGGNTNTTGFTALPGVTNLTVTWTKAATGYAGVYGTDFVVETSGSLATGSWENAVEGAEPDEVSFTGNDVTYTFPPGTMKFARLKVTGP